MRLGSYCVIFSRLLSRHLILAVGLCAIFSKRSLQGGPKNGTVLGSLNFIKY